MSIRLGIVVLLASSLASGDSGPPMGTLEGRIVEGTSLAPIEGATIVVTDARRGPVVVSGATDANGWFRYHVPPGRYDVLAIFGDARWIHPGVVVETNKVVQVAGAVSLEAEMVTVKEKAPKKEHRAAEAVRSTVKPILPYSDEAIDQNIWAVGWMLLDIDELGVVTGFRYLHRPTHGLDVIAEREIWSLRFEPARDDAGTPMASKVLWKLEWPAFHYAKDHQLLGLGGDNALAPAMREKAFQDKRFNGSGGVETRAMLENELSTDIGRVGDRGAPGGGENVKISGRAGRVNGSNGPGTFLLPDGEHRPPCKGQAPLNLDMDVALYRDCTPPDLSKVNTEPVIKRPTQ